MTSSTSVSVSMPTCRWALFAGGDRVLGDPTLRAQLRPDRLREAEVRRAVAVQMAEWPAADGERELAASARPGRDTGPRGDLGGDAPAGGEAVGGSGHSGPPGADRGPPARHYKFK